MTPAMSDLHRRILNRLLAAWTAISLVVGGVALFLGMQKVDAQLVALATAESGKISAASLPLLGASNRSALDRLAADFVREHFIVVELYDRERQRLTRAANPAHAELADQLARQTDLPPPGDGERHYRKRAIGDQTVLQVTLPLKDSAGTVAGYFEGIFLIDRTTLDRLRQDMVVTLSIVLLAVLLTTVAFYPVILALNRDVLRYSRDLLKSNIELMETLGSAVAQRDSNTSLHNYRVSIYAVRLAEAAGLDPTAIRQLIAGAFLHDVGKIGISDTILLKPGRLTSDEFSIMKGHVAFGVDLLKKSPWLQRARDVVECHHERFDGTGYPAGLAGEAIPVRARIFAIVDVFDALTSKRPYKEAFPFEETMAILRSESGKHFDPRLLATFDAIAEPLFLQVTGSAAPAVEAMLRDLIDRYYYADDLSRESPAAAG
jgi:HD-GYP domain-containing protein (c-di-GMP phosphodiesterase class II)